MNNEVIENRLADVQDALNGAARQLEDISDVLAQYGVKPGSRFDGSLSKFERALVKIDDAIAILEEEQS